MDNHSCARIRCSSRARRGALEAKSGQGPWQSGAFKKVADVIGYMSCMTRAHRSYNHCRADFGESVRDVDLHLVRRRGRDLPIRLSDHRLADCNATLGDNQLWQQDERRSTVTHSSLSPWNLIPVPLSSTRCLAKYQRPPNLNLPRRERFVPRDPMSPHLGLLRSGQHSTFPAEQHWRLKGAKLPLSCCRAGGV